MFFQGSFSRYYSCVKVSKGTDNEYNFPFNAQRKLVKGETVEVLTSAERIGVADGFSSRRN